MPLACWILKSCVENTMSKIVENYITNILVRYIKYLVSFAKSTMSHHRCLHQYSHHHPTKKNNNHHTYSPRCDIHKELLPWPKRRRTSLDPNILCTNTHTNPQYIINILCIRLSINNKCDFVCACALHSQPSK